MGKRGRMKVFVAGASGRVGKEIVKLLHERGMQVKAASRNAGDLEWPDGVEAVRFDFHEEVSEMAQKLEGVGAVCFVAGSRGKDLLQVDAFGAVKLMRAAQIAGARRFIMLSSIFSMQPERWALEPSLAPIANYNIAKFFADEWLTKNTDLDWTIIQPSVLKEEPGTGKIELDPPHDGSNPIPDVAKVIAESIDRPNTIGKVIMMRSGDEPISDALDRA